MGTLVTLMFDNKDEKQQFMKWLQDRMEVKNLSSHVYTFDEASYFQITMPDNTQYHFSNGETPLADWMD